MQKPLNQTSLNLKFENNYEPAFSSIEFFSSSPKINLIKYSTTSSSPSFKTTRRQSWKSKSDIGQFLRALRF